MQNTQNKMAQAQRGSVLIVALMLLLVLTILGVTAMGNMTMEERMASGYQKMQLAVEGGTSAINRVANASVDFMLSDLPADQRPANPFDGLALGIENAKDRDDVTIDGTTSAKVTVAYVGDTYGIRLLPGSEAVGVMYDIRTDTTVAVAGVTTAESVQVQTVQWAMPSMGDNTVSTYDKDLARHLSTSN